MPPTTARTKWLIQRIIPFGVVFVLTGCVFLLVEHATIQERGGISTTAIDLSLPVFLFAILSVFIFGLLVGLAEVVYLERRFTDFTFSKKLLYKVLIYAAMFSLIILLTFPIAASLEIEASVFDKRVWSKYFSFLGSITHFSTMFQLTVSLVVALFYSEVSHHLGYGVPWNFFTGKYHKAHEEERIFMFLDMRDSTAIAEELGHQKYFEFLKSYYNHLSDAVIRFDGSVYQYVGDEMVITWPIKLGLRNSACIRCYFAMKRDLAGRTGWYEEHYGIVPAFKAGVHCGNVTIGEIGVVKKELLYTGDVLNATARIQALCNTYQTELLISDDLMKALSSHEILSAKSIGEIELKGRRERMELWTVDLLGEVEKQ